MKGKNNNFVKSIYALTLAGVPLKKKNANTIRKSQINKIELERKLKMKLEKKLKKNLK